MKPLTILSILLFGFLSSYAQTEYSKVLTLDSSCKKNQNYSKAIKWVTQTFKSAQDVIQLKDQENGDIIVKGIINATPVSGFFGPLSQGTYATIEIIVKDGKAKMVFSQLYFKYSIGDPPSYKEYTIDDVKKGVNMNCGEACRANYIKSLESEITRMEDNLTAFLLKKSDDGF